MSSPTESEHQLRQATLGPPWMTKLAKIAVLNTRALALLFPFLFLLPPTNVSHLRSAYFPQNSVFDITFAMGDQSTPPTFKLVLVGDGGTGKVRSIQNRASPGFTSSRGAMSTSLRSSSKVISLGCYLGSSHALLPKQSSPLPSPPLPCPAILSTKMENICPTLASPAQRHR